MSGALLEAPFPGHREEAHLFRFHERHHLAQVLGGDFDVTAEGGEHGVAAALEGHVPEPGAGLFLDEVQRRSPAARRSGDARHDRVRVFAPASASSLNVLNFDSVRTATTCGSCAKRDDRRDGVERRARTPAGPMRSG